MDRLSRYYHTLVNLRWRQIYYQIYYRIFGLRSKHISTRKIDSPVPLKFNILIRSRDVFDNNIFTFLNRARQFEDTIDWNFSTFGKLWTYHLNYFNFLFGSRESQNTLTDLMLDFASRYFNLQDGIEPYPISVRIRNWIKFIAYYQISQRALDRVVMMDAEKLQRRLEYHLMANHLLENALGLLFAAYHFRDHILYQKARKLLERQLSEQVLTDGAHFERSPMYHQHILLGILDAVQLLSLNRWQQDTLVETLRESAGRMLSWLKQITFPDGSIPYIKDAAEDHVPATKDLIDYAQELEIEILERPLSDSGYRRIKADKYHLLIDIGNIQPSYQPGHAHADTFNFLLYSKKPFVVEVGTSTYDLGPRRSYERSTAAHNTVVLDGQNSSAIWSSFRVGKRAGIRQVVEGDQSISATHDGYRSKGVLHRRTWSWHSQGIEIADELIGTKHMARAYFHLAPDVVFEDHHRETITTNLGEFVFEGHSAVHITNYDLARGFNKTEKCSVIQVDFDHQLITKIVIH